MRGLISILLLSISLVQVSAQEAYLRQVNTLGNEFYPNEPSTCIHKTDPAIRIAAANIDHYYRSADTGNVWDAMTMGSALGIWGDPVLHATPDGSVYYTHLSRTPGKDEHYGYIDRIVVQRSDNQGKTYTPGVGVGLNGDKQQDKPWMSSDDWSTRFKGNLYLTWTEFDKINDNKNKYKSRIRFSRSDAMSKGDVWSPAVSISDVEGSSMDDDRSLEGATTAVDREGNIYCVWAGFNKLFFDRSTDGGKTWGTDKVIAEQKSGWVMEIDHVFRSNGMPFLLMDNSQGEHDGRLYVVYGDTSGKTGADVMFTYSDDRGDTWSAPRVVRGPADSTIANDQFMPNACIDQSSGELFVLYRDRSECPFNIFTHTTLASSTDGGESWKLTCLSREATSPRGEDLFSGDYIDLDAHDGHFSAVWTEYHRYSRVYAYSSYGEAETPELRPNRLSFFVEKSRGRKDLYVYRDASVLWHVKTYRKRWFGGEKYLGVNVFHEKNMGKTDIKFADPSTIYTRDEIPRGWRKRNYLVILGEKEYATVHPLQ